MTDLTRPPLDLSSDAYSLLRAMAQGKTVNDESNTQEQATRETERRAIEQLTARGLIAVNCTYQGMTTRHGGIVETPPISVYQITPTGRQALAAYEQEGTHAMPASHLLHMGNVTVTTQGDEFSNGYHQGMYAFTALPRPVTDRMLYEFCMQHLLDVHHPSVWNTGYLLGAVASFYQASTGDEPFSTAPVVQLSPTVTLRLDNWRFRLGFFEGQENAQFGLTTSQTLTARDLLSYIAVRDAETGQYRLDDKASNALAHHIGDFVGFLCAVLFPSAQIQDMETQP